MTDGSFSRGRISTTCTILVWKIDTQNFDIFPCSAKQFRRSVVNTPSEEQDQISGILLHNNPNLIICGGAIHTCVSIVGGFTYIYPLVDPVDDNRPQKRHTEYL